jgi:hypothetical protein
MIMRHVLIYLVPILVVLLSCQKVETVTTYGEDQEELSSPETMNFLDDPSLKSVQTSSTDFVTVIIGMAPRPSILGEVQVGLSTALTHPVYVHFKIKELIKLSTTPSYLYGPNLASADYVIPAGQRYLVCDIDDYWKSITKDSTFTTKSIDLLLQICSVSDNVGFGNYLIDFSIIKLQYGLNSTLTFSYFLKAGDFVLPSVLSCGSSSFYKPPTGSTEPPPLPPTKPTLPEN